MLLNQPKDKGALVIIAGQNIVVRIVDLGDMERKQQQKMRVRWQIA